MARQIIVALQPGIPCHLSLVATSGVAANSLEEWRGAHLIPLFEVLEALTPRLVNQCKEPQDRIVHRVPVKSLVLSTPWLQSFAGNYAVPFPMLRLWWLNGRIQD